MKPLVTIIILNYQNAIDTVACINSLSEISYPNFKIIMVDNNSQDNSFEVITNFVEGSKFIGQLVEKEDLIGEQTFDLSANLFLLQSAENGGFGHGNNLGIKLALEKLNSDFVLLLNNDTEVEQGFLEPLVDHALVHPNLGIVSSKINYFHDKKMIWFNGGKVDLCTGSITHFNFKEPDLGQKPDSVVSFITGCLWLVPHHVFDDVGLIEEDYFMYVEDIDFCTRVREKGYKLDVLPICTVYHKVGASTGGNFTDFSVFWRTRNMHLFFKRFSSHFFCRMISVGRFDARLIYKIIMLRKFSLLKAYVRALFSSI